MSALKTRIYWCKSVRLVRHEGEAVATYYGVYQPDLYENTKVTALPVYLLDQGERVNTNRVYDDSFLPSIFRDYLVTDYKGAVCDIAVQRLRVARLVISNEQSLVITCPFRGNTANMVTFLDSLNQLTEVSYFVIVGERYSRFFTEKFTS